jgi:uncharacterized protein YbaR (Trm112 family)
MTGPALVVCPECKEEISTIAKVCVYGKVARIFVPVRFCPKCRTSLKVPDRTGSRDQACLILPVDPRFPKMSYEPDKKSGSTLHGPEVS